LRCREAASPRVSHKRGAVGKWFALARKRVK
jgi:hypothetical protein